MQLATLEAILTNSSSDASHRAIVGRLREALETADAATSRDVIEVLARLGSLDDDPITEQVITAATSTLSVSEVAALLRRPSSTASDPFHELIPRATASEQRLLRSLRHTTIDRSRETALISAIAGASGMAPADVRTAATALGSLSAAAEFAFTDSRDGRSDLAVEPGRPVMLMGPSPSVDIDDVVAPGVPMVVEQHLPGDRIQAHRRGGQVWLFDAHGADVTGRHPLIASVVANAARGDLVLDGVVALPDRGGTAPPQARFFDLLFDGESLIDHPLVDRRARLASLLAASHRVPSVVTAVRADIESMLRQAVQLGHDGVLLKELAAPYDGSAASSAWRVLAPAFTFSLVATGAEMGSGERDGPFSIVHVSARSSSGHVRVGRVSRGLTRTMLNWQTARFRELATPSPAPTDATELRLRPELVLDVRCTGVVDDESLPGGVRITQPKVVRYRPDLDPHDAATVDDLMELLPTETRTTAAGAATVPTLPSRNTSPGLPPPAPAAVPTRIEAPTTSETETSAPKTMADVDYPSYVAPLLDRSPWPARAVLGARSLALAWVLAVTIAAWTEVGPGTLDLLTQAGFAVLAAIALTGWWWTDRLTRDLQRLDGRLPSRLRSVTGWTIPVAVVVALELTIARAEPTAVFDVRPSIIVGLSALAFWRPYALVRRILVTLTRLPQDALLGAGYVIDLVAFGLVWWRLSTRDAGSAAAGFDDLVGVGASATLAVGGGVAVWVLLTRACDRAIGHRAASQRTRYDHRMLRLAGIDPTDPDVWWELVARRAREERAAELTAFSEAQFLTPAVRLGPSDVDALVADVRRTHAPELRRLGEERSRDLMDRLRERVESIVPTSSHPSVDAGGVGGLAQPLVPDTNDGPASGPRRPAAYVTPAEARPEQLGVTTGVPSPPSVGLGADEPIAQLLRQAQSAQVEAALAEQRRSIDDKHSDGERMVPPTLFPLDAVRLLLVLVFVCITAAAAWFLTLVLGAGGEFGVTAANIRDIESARQTLIIAFLFATGLVPLWALLYGFYAEQAGAPERSLRPSVALLVLGASASVVALVEYSGGSGALALGMAVVSTLIATLAALSLEPTRRWFELRSRTLIAWALILPTLFGVAGAGGLLTEIGTSESLLSLVFVSALLTLASALMTVFAALSSSDLQDEIRVTPSMAVPARKQRRRRK